MTKLRQARLPVWMAEPIPSCLNLVISPGAPRFDLPFLLVRPG